MEEGAYDQIGGDMGPEAVVLGDLSPPEVIGMGMTADSSDIVDIDDEEMIKIARK